jgi:TPP-dependent trihydroxycyclohexane-1,2-dione (THcHDO) dehydratase
VNGPLALCNTRTHNQCTVQVCATGCMPAPVRRLWQLSLNASHHSNRGVATHACECKQAPLTLLAGHGRKEPLHVRQAGQHLVPQ